MKLYLTDSQICLLEWDRKPGKRTKKGREFEITEEEKLTVIDTVETLCYGCDGPITKSARAILRKLLS